jgi:transposase
VCRLRPTVVLWNDSLTSRRIDDVPATRPQPIVLSEFQREHLQRWVSTPGTPARITRRSRILLQLASGCSVHRAAQLLGTSEPTVRLWRDRFRHGGLDAITTDAPRPGRPRRARDQAQSAVAARLSSVPSGRPLSIRALARETGLGRHLVHQVLRDMGLLTPAVATPRAKDVPD